MPKAVLTRWFLELVELVAWLVIIDDAHTVAS